MAETTITTITTIMTTARSYRRRSFASARWKPS